MNKVIQGIIIAIILLIVSFIHPLNNANAKLQDVYVVTPTDTIVKIEDVKAIWTKEYWICLECIKDMIELDNSGSPQLALQHRIYQRTNQTLPVNAGYVPVLFFMEYKGFWIWKVDR